jgi:hypothetical protein
VSASRFCAKKYGWKMSVTYFYGALLKISLRSFSEKKKIKNVPWNELAEFWCVMERSKVGVMWGRKRLERDPRLETVDRDLRVVVVGDGHWQGCNSRETSLPHAHYPRKANHAHCHLIHLFTLVTSVARVRCASRAHQIFMTTNAAHQWLKEGKAGFYPFL